MQLILNGKPITSEETNLQALLSALGYEGNHFAVAVNQACVPRSQFLRFELKPQDEIEILGPQQGG